MTTTCIILIIIIGCIIIPFIIGLFNISPPETTDTHTYVIITEDLAPAVKSLIATVDVTLNHTVRTKFTNKFDELYYIHVNEVLDSVQSFSKSIAREDLDTLSVYVGYEDFDDYLMYNKPY